MSVYLYLYILWDMKVNFSRVLNGYYRFRNNDVFLVLEG